MQQRHWFITLDGGGFNMREVEVVLDADLGENDAIFQALDDLEIDFTCPLYPDTNGWRGVRTADGFVRFIVFGGESRTKWARECGQQAVRLVGMLGDMPRSDPRERDAYLSGVEARLVSALADVRERRATEQARIN